MAIVYGLETEKNQIRNQQTTFTYSVPNINMCKNCHVKNNTIVPIGPSAKQLNRNKTFKNKQYKC